MQQHGGKEEKGVLPETHKPRTLERCFGSWQALQRNTSALPSSTWSFQTRGRSPKLFLTAHKSNEGKSRDGEGSSTVRNRGQKVGMWQLVKSTGQHRKRWRWGAETSRAYSLPSELTTGSPQTLHVCIFAPLCEIKSRHNQFFSLMDKLWQSKIQWLKVNQTSRQINKRVTYSTFFDHSGGLLKVMNTQLVKIVHIMIMLNTVEKSQGRIHKLLLFPSENKHFTLGTMRSNSITWRRQAQKRRRRGGDGENGSPQNPTSAPTPHGEVWVRTAGAHHFQKGCPSSPPSG